MRSSCIHYINVRIPHDGISIWIWRNVDEKLGSSNCQEWGTILVRRMSQMATGVQTKKITNYRLSSIILLKSWLYSLNGSRIHVNKTHFTSLKSHITSIKSHLLLALDTIFLCTQYQVSKNSALTKSSPNIQNASASYFRRSHSHNNSDIHHRRRSSFHFRPKIYGSYRWLCSFIGTY